MRRFCKISPMLRRLLIVVAGLIVFAPLTLAAQNRALLYPGSFHHRALPSRFAQRNSHHDDSALPDVGRIYGCCLPPAKYLPHSAIVRRCFILAA